MLSETQANSKELLKSQSRATHRSYKEDNTRTYQERLTGAAKSDAAVYNNRHDVICFLSHLSRVVDKQ